MIVENYCDEGINANKKRLLSFKVKTYPPKRIKPNEGEEGDEECKQETRMVTPSSSTSSSPCFSLSEGDDEEEEGVFSPTSTSFSMYISEEDDEEDDYSIYDEEADDMGEEERGKRNAELTRMVEEYCRQVEWIESQTFL
jgi:cobalamin biosynthesis protein CobT